MLLCDILSKTSAYGCCSHIGLLASPGTPTSHTFIYAFSGVSLLNKYPGAGFGFVPCCVSLPRRVPGMSSTRGLGIWDHWESLRGSWSAGALGMRSGRVGTSLSYVKTLEQGQFQGSPLSL